MLWGKQEEVIMLMNAAAKIVRDIDGISHSTSGKAGGLKNVNRSKRLRNH